MQFEKKTIIFEVTPLSSLESMEWRTHGEELALDRHFNCLSLVMGGKADYMGTGLSGMEIWDWKSEWVVYLRSPVWVSPSQSASAFSDREVWEWECGRRYWRYEGKGKGMNRLPRWVGEGWISRTAGVQPEAHWRLNSASLKPAELSMNTCSQK